MDAFRRRDSTAAGMGWRIELLRAHLGLSQKDPAELLGHTKEGVAKWEQGVAPFSPDHMKIIAKTWKVSTDFLIYGEWAGMATDIRKSLMVSAAEAEKPANPL